MNKCIVLTDMGGQPKGTVMKSQEWGRMLSHPMTKEIFNKTFEKIN
jgi:hypothetical protein